ncbi:hypothetical protein Emed_006775 [Eimeria media]
MAVHLANWTKYLVYAPKDKPLDKKSLKGRIWEQHEYKNSVKYTLVAEFTRLTPKYDPKTMGATVLKEVSKLFAEFNKEADYELGLSRRHVRSVLLGDEGGDQLRVTITAAPRERKTGWV